MMFVGTLQTFVEESWRCDACHDDDRYEPKIADGVEQP
jgi:hypothetical protein